MTFEADEENSICSTMDMDLLPVPAKRMQWRKPIRDRERLAYLLRWSVEHWRDDPRQPADLDNLMIDAAESIGNSCSIWWAFIAIAETFAIALMLWR